VSQRQSAFLHAELFNADELRPACFSVQSQKHEVARPRLRLFLSALRRAVCLGSFERVIAMRFRFFFVALNNAFVRFLVPLCA